MSKFTEITAAQAQDLIASGNPVLLDHRDQHSYQQGHIDGAVNSQTGATEKLIREADYERPVIVYCYHGNSSKDLAAYLAAAGFEQVYSVIGGYGAWQQ